MCGRARSGATRSQILNILNEMNALNHVSADVDTTLPNIQITDNIKPGMLMNIAFVRDGKLEIKEMKWGLNMGFKKVFNTRSEDAETKKLFSSMMQKNQRGLVFIDGYYETEKKQKQKYYFAGENEQLLAVPVLQRGYEFSIFTKEAADTDIKIIHERQPVVFDRLQVNDWLQQCDINTSKTILHTSNDIKISANV